MQPDGIHLGWGLALLGAGLLLCFTGARSLRLAAGCAGFGMGSVLAAALLGGLGATQVRSPVLAVITALAGAGLAVRGAVALVPGVLGFLREPTTLFGSLVATAVWLALAGAGWTAQRRSRSSVP